MRKQQISGFMGFFKGIGSIQLSSKQGSSIVDNVCLPAFHSSWVSLRIAVIRQEAGCVYGNWFLPPCSKAVLSTCLVSFIGSRTFSGMMLWVSPPPPALSPHDTPWGRPPLFSRGFPYIINPSQSSTSPSEFLFLHFVYISCVNTSVHAMVHRGEAENSLPELIFSFYHMGPGDRTQVIRLGGNHPYLLSHLDSPL